MVTLAKKWTLERLWIFKVSLLAQTNPKLRIIRAQKTKTVRSERKRNRRQCDWPDFPQPVTQNMPENEDEGSSPQPDDQNEFHYTILSTPNFNSSKNLQLPWFDRFSCENLLDVDSTFQTKASVKCCFRALSSLKPWKKLSLSIFYNHITFTTASFGQLFSTHPPPHTPSKATFSQTWARPPSENQDLKTSKTNRAREEWQSEHNL